MSSTVRLYTPEVLALATSLARFPLDECMALRGTARSATCGSTVEVGLSLDRQGVIESIGLGAHACAVGQAAAAIFADGARGADGAMLEASLADLEAWLAGGDPPGWPGFEAIAAARDYPARHGAILLPWRAALVALDRGG